MMTEKKSHMILKRLSKKRFLIQTFFSTTPSANQINFMESGINYLLRNSLYYMLVFLIALGLKYHYSRAGSDGLAWVLTPVAGLVELISGIPFENEAHAGYVSRGYRVIIASACAGINFLIIAFCMAAFAGLHAFERHRSKMLWLAIGFLGTYLLTIAANSLRIIVSIYSHNASIGLGWMTAARIHRLEGIVIYFFFLSLFYMIIKQVVCRFGGGPGYRKPAAGRPGGITTKYFRWACTGFIPLFWYGLVTLGVPLVNGAWQADATRFAEHSRMVLSTSIAVLGALFLLRIVGHTILCRFSKKNSAKRNDVLNGCNKKRSDSLTPFISHLLCR